MKVQKDAAPLAETALTDTCGFVPAAGVLAFVFSVVAVQGGLQTWAVSVLGVISLLCLILTMIVWRQPQSKAKLAFKVTCCPFLVYFLTVSA